MKILCMLPAGRGVYPAQAAERRLDVMRSYATEACLMACGLLDRRFADLLCDPPYR